MKIRFEPGRRLSAAAEVLAVVAAGAAAALMALLLSAESYAPQAGALAKLGAGLSNPAIAALNLLPPLWLAALGCLLTRRVWAGYLISAVPTLGLATANCFKVALRGDPLLFSDLALARTAGGIVSRYQLPRSPLAIGVGVCAAALLVLFLYLPPLELLSARARMIGALALLTVAPPLLAPCYLSDASYAATENSAYVSESSDNELYASRGFCYSFLHSMPDYFSAIPANYDAGDARRILSNYRDADIPDGRKVQVVGVMLESFCDLTDYPVLAEHSGVAEAYAPLHRLERRCVSGDLVTNIFSGGTVDSEWDFLTGYSHLAEFTQDVESYVRYFKAQGYDTVYQHPGYSWFYDRLNINGYLGFDRSVFTEDGFGRLVDPDLAVYRSDGVLFNYLLDSLDSRTETDAPLFSFSVTYQNHGPYDNTLFDGAPVTPENSPWSEETCGILSHYLYNISNTVRELVRFTSALEKRDEPVVAVFFGDHKPWLGNDKSVYAELGVNLDLMTEDGFRNFYCTPYLIFANSAAERVLGRSFTGDGGEMSPCMLMTKLFDLCGWDGPAFMQFSREMRAYTPLVHLYGRFLVDGQFLTKEELPDDVLDFYLNYRKVEDWLQAGGLGSGAEEEISTAPVQTSASKKPA